jgi:predicted Zn finger-like uncharacterized protein
MDVRCEKCQTEYELDESRLKPGGVTVKCTNCGHMFKIRKRASTNVGIPSTPVTPTPVVAAPPQSVDPPRAKAPSRATPPMPQAAMSMPRAASNSDAPMGITDAPSGPSSQRQWLVRLENGETRTCSELATLQQWIVAGAVSRESLISRSGKTWKRLGDIAELSQYFVIADEAKVQRSARPTGQPTKGPAAATMLGVGGRPPTHDDDEGRNTGNFRARPPTPAPPKAAPIPSAIAQTELAPSGPMSVPRRPPTQPPPPPAAKKIDVPPGRATAAWANHEVKASESMAAMPQGPRGGKLSAAPADEGFAGKVRVQPSDRSTFDGKVATMDDDDDVYQTSRGSRAGMWIALVALLVIGAAAGAVYMFVFKGGKQEPVAQVTTDAGVAAPADAGQNVVVAPINVDAAVETASPLDAARGELVAGVHARMKKALDSLDGKDDPASLALRARLMTGLAQGMQDRAGFVDKAEADKLRKEAKQIVIDAAPLAQRALAGQADSVDANLAMADLLRLQGKPAPSVKRYITTAKGKADKAAAPSVALSEALLSMRDGKLPDAANALAAQTAPDDMRIKTALALIAYAQNKQTDAKAQVDQILATQPDHDAALAMYKKLETVVAKDDPLPPEDGGNKGNATTKPPTNPPQNTGGGGGGGNYDSLLAQANKAAEQNCTKAMDLYDRALQQKPQGVEALTGMGYCHLDRKEFSSAFSKFRAALLVSPRFEPALGGIAETYQRQGNKASAIEAWNKYLVVFPGSPKAKKQLEILGAGDAPKPPPPPQPEEKKPEGGGTDTPPPPPSPTPTPAPEAGSASN